MIAPFGPDGPLPHGFSMPKPFLRSLRVFPLFIMSSALVACAGAPEVERDPQARIERYLENAYRPDAPLAVTAWDDVWTLGEMPVDVSWMGPTQPQAAPLILYLPGLGEDSRAAARWRRAWAEAGYAVLSLQPVSEGRAVYSSAEAQVGSFRSLAQKHFSREALALRVRVVDEAQAELRRQAATGRPELTGIDWQRVAVAGFDLGHRRQQPWPGSAIPEQRRERAGCRSQRCCSAPTWKTPVIPHVSPISRHRYSRLPDLGTKTRSVGSLHRINARGSGSRYGFRAAINCWPGMLRTEPWEAPLSQWSGVWLDAHPKRGVRRGRRLAPAVTARGVPVVLAVRVSAGPLVGEWDMAREWTTVSIPTR